MNNQDTQFIQSIAQLLIASIAAGVMTAVIICVVLVIATS